jgi:ABC-type ATPase involved in cell division
MIQVRQKNALIPPAWHLHEQGSSGVSGSVGSSGAGKSTLMKMLYLEERPTRGQVYIGGINDGLHNQ